jgi:hypothetical protein
MARLPNSSVTMRFFFFAGTATNVCVAFWQRTNSL